MSVLAGFITWDTATLDLRTEIQGKGKRESLPITDTRKVTARMFSDNSRQQQYRTEMRFAVDFVPLDLSRLPSTADVVCDSLSRLSPHGH